MALMDFIKKQFIDILQWTEDTDEHLRSYVNGIPTGSGGTHENGRRTWGHSLIADPWGQVLAQRTQGGQPGGGVEPVRTRGPGGTGMSRLYPSIRGRREADAARDRGR
mgnify:CR=1 FL=1